MPRAVRTAILWVGFAYLIATGGCQGESHQPGARDGSQAQGTLTRRVAELAQSSPYFLIDSRTGRLRQKGWLPAKERVSRYFGLQSATRTVAGVTLEMVDVSPPAFVLASALQTSFAPTTFQTQLPLQSLRACPLLNLDNSGRLSQSGRPASTSAATLGRIGNFALVTTANDIHFVSEHCIVPIEDFEGIDTLVSSQQYYTVPHANPQDPNQAIQLGADIETKNLELIVQWFRPPDIQETDWLVRSIHSRRSHLESILTPIALRLAQVGSTDLPHEKTTGWIKTKLTPAFLANALDCEGWSRGGYVVEVKIDHSHLAATLDDLRNMLDTLSQLGLADGSRHIHISFPGTGITEGLVRHFANYYHYINEYLTLVHLAHYGDSASLHRYFRPILVDDVEFIHKWLTSLSNPTLSDEQTYRHVAFRTPALYGADRFGFEVRAFANHDVLTAQMDVVALTILLLGNLEVYIQTPYGRTFSMDEFTPNGGRADTLNRTVIERFPPELLSFLEQLSAVVDPDQQLDPSAPVVWALPLVRWWERGFLRHLQPQIEQAKDEYLTELWRYRALAHGNAPPSDDDLIQMVSLALSGWATETGLWQHYRGFPTLAR